MALQTNEPVEPGACPLHLNRPYRDQLAAVLRLRTKDGQQCAAKSIVAAPPGILAGGQDNAGTGLLWGAADVFPQRE